MDSITQAYEEMMVEVAAMRLLESVPSDYWKPSKEAQDQVRKEVVDKMLAPAKDVNTFHKQFQQDIRDRASQMSRQVDDWHKEGKFQWKPGDMVHSPKTGKTYEITGYTLTGRLKSPDPGYTYKHGEEGVTKDWERGTFIASKAHESLKKIN